MPDRMEIIAELRTLFKDGATFSGLLHHIRVRHNGEPLDHWLIRDYLMEAFALPIVRGSSSIFDVDPGGSSDQLAVLTRTVIPEIIERREEWDYPLASMTTQKSWLDGLTITNHEARLEATRASRPSWLSEATWEVLSTQERDSLCVSLASAQTATERAVALAHLAERLQEKIHQLEQRLLADPPTVAQTGSSPDSPS